ncbi:hypothetical protein YPPY36_2108, partial [Yersinia pestis PY-36]
MASNFCREF